MSESPQRLEEIARDLDSDAKLYAKKATAAGKAGETQNAEYARGASWAFALASQRLAGEVQEILYA